MKLSYGLEIVLLLTKKLKIQKSRLYQTTVLNYTKVQLQNFYTKIQHTDYTKIQSKIGTKYSKKIIPKYASPFC